MVNHAGNRGFAVVEIVIAILVFSIVIAAAYTGNAGQLRQVGSAFAETKALRIASSRLEALRDVATPLALGDSVVAVPKGSSGFLPSVRAIQTVRRLEAELTEVEVIVSWLPRGAKTRRRIYLTTWLDRRAK